MIETQLARFFCVKGPSDIPYFGEHAAKKSSYEEREIPPAQLAWLFRVKQIAGHISVPQYSEKALRSALAEFESCCMHQTRFGVCRESSWNAASGLFSLRSCQTQTSMAFASGWMSFLLLSA